MGITRLDFASALASDGVDIDVYELAALNRIAERSGSPVDVIYNWAWSVSQEVLAKECKMGRQKLVGVLQALCRKGYILRKSETAKKSVHQYCITVAPYIDYVNFMISLKLNIEKAYGKVFESRELDEVCRTDFEQQILRCRCGRHQENPVVAVDDIKSVSVVAVDDMGDVAGNDTERDYLKGITKTKGISPPTPNGVVAGGGVVSFSFSQLKTIYDYARAHYPILAEKVSAMPDDLPGSRKRAISKAISKKRPEAWVSYFKSLVPLFRSFSGDNLLCWERLVLETEDWELKVKEHRAKAKKGR